MIKMTKLNWRDAKQELPTQVDEFGLTDCLVKIRITNSLGKPCYVIGYDVYEHDKKNWSENDDAEVTHWIYANEARIASDRLVVNWRKYPDEKPYLNSEVIALDVSCGTELYFYTYTKHGFCERYNPTDSYYDSVTHWFYKEELSLPKEKL